MTSTAYIAVHGGAGVHGVHHEKEIKHALRKACTEGLMMRIARPLSAAFVAVPVSEASAGVTVAAASADNAHSDFRPSARASSSSSSSLDMVERAIAVLEDDGRLNAGYGSNLTLDGTVECDAAIMSARDGGLFGSVGAVSGVKNPISLAKAILDYSYLPNKFGRVPPLTLASSGAHNFAAGKVEIVPPEALIAPSAHEQWKKWKTRLESSEQALEAREEQEAGLNDMQDTVGAVAFHPAVGMATGVSSGGLLLKWPGRIGEAAIFGAGCWANQEMSCSVSGTGEHIIRENLARKLGDAFSLEGTDADSHEILHHVLLKFWNSCRNRGEDAPAVGVLLLTSDHESVARLWCAFTTASMAIGYASSRDAKPKAVILRHPNASTGREDGKAQIYITSISLA